MVRGLTYFQKQYPISDQMIAALQLFHEVWLGRGLLQMHHLIRDLP